MKREELVYSSELGFGVVKSDNGTFLVVSFGSPPERIVLEREEVVTYGFIDEDEWEDDDI